MKFRSPRASRATCARLIVASVLAALPSARITAQPISAACAETCPNALTDPFGAAACAARVSTCQSKLVLYQSYMAQLGLNVPRFPLPAFYVEILQPHYPGANLSTWRFGASDRQPPNNTTTDCTVTYFNPGFPNYTARLTTGALNTEQELNLLMHELAHVEQCMQAGGRDRYARMWFEQAELAFLQSADLTAIHDLQPMENQADARALTVFTATARHRNTDGRFVAPQSNLRTASITGPANLRAGYCTLRITLVNLGTGAIPAAAYSNANAVVRVLVGGQVIGQATLAQLDPDRVLRRVPPQFHSVTWRPGTVYTFTGTRTVEVRVDPSAVIPDSNRGDNQSTESLSCAIAPIQLGPRGGP